MIIAMSLNRVWRLGASGLAAFAKQLQDFLFKLMQHTDLSKANKIIFADWLPAPSSGKLKCVDRVVGYEDFAVGSGCPTYFDEVYSMSTFLVFAFYASHTG